MYRVVLVLLAAVSGSFSQLVFTGDCPITSGSTSASNFIGILGTWYQIARIQNSNERGECSTTTFEGTSVAETMINREVFFGLDMYRNGTIQLLPEPHKFLVKFPDELIEKYYYLMGTDFVNYAVIGRCDVYRYPFQNRTETHLYGWKFSRSTTLTPASNTAIDQLLADVPYLQHSNNWRPTSHTSEACQVGENGVGSIASSTVLVVTALLFAVKIYY